MKSIIYKSLLLRLALKTITNPFNIEHRKKRRRARK